jgi:hypothetical protein
MKDEIERGDVPKSIQCHMKEKGVSQEVARQHVEDLIRDAWKRLNEECMSTTTTHPIVQVSLDIARISQFFYQYGDGYGSPGRETKERVLKLIVENV